jgi:hypothetical protein
VLASADGVYTVAVRITDAAGNQIVVTKQIRLDRSRPTITETGLTPGGVYLLGQTITLKITDSDVDDVKTVTAKLDSTTLGVVANGTATDTISTDSLTAGTHRVTITATDQLGNQSTLTVTFTIQVTTGGLQAAVNDGVSRGLVDYSLSVQLNNNLGAAQAAINRGDKASARVQLQTFIGRIQSVAGTKKVDPAYAGMLIGWANSLIAQL